MAVLERFTFGVGDRFGHQARAQLRACELAAEAGVIVVPVWNKSNREHNLIGSEPAAVKAAAQAAVEAAGWRHGWHVDADHIGRQTVERFLEASDFFTIDVADFIGRESSAEDVKTFVERHPELTGTIDVPGLREPLSMTKADMERTAGQYLAAVREAGAVYREIVKRKAAATVIAEVSMDETDQPQTPGELLVILAALADERVPVQTIAPKFSGRFNKGVDYVGDVAQFEVEFSADLAVVAWAVRQYGLPGDLKLSVHSGSDKFSIYPVIARAIARTGAGLHVKTAGTNWLEELIGLAQASPAGLTMVKTLYAQSLERADELCAPYATVIDIDRSRLPSASEAGGWTAEQWVGALEHEPHCPQFNPHLRQLLHVAFKLAAKQGTAYTDLLKQHADLVGRCVTHNLFERHLKPLFLPLQATGTGRGM